MLEIEVYGARKTEVILQELMGLLDAQMLMVNEWNSPESTRCSCYFGYSLFHVTLTTLNFSGSHFGMISPYVTCLLLIALLKAIFH